MNVLIVEDDRFFQENIQRTLSMTIPNVDMVVVGTVDDALVQFKSAGSVFQLVIVDLHLSNGDGVDVIRHIAHHNPATFILVLSVNSNEARVLEAIRAGATGYVIKGDVMLSLKSAIEQVLCGAFPLSPILAGYFLRLAGRDSITDPQKDQTIQLTSREIELLNHFAAGRSYNEAAEAMNISITTVRTHTTNLYRKMGVRSNIKALSVAKRHGLIKV